MLPPNITGIPIYQINCLEDDQVVHVKNPQMFYMGYLAYLQTMWLAGGTIDDFIEWRCAFYSKQIDKKYYLS